ncbi:MAG: DUF4493 domain-containing protein [Alistipes sp.]|nr:DUF4493 domain-containing protein [Alistipes sp.]
MKSLLRFIGVFVLAALTLASCRKDKVDYNPGEKDNVENIGYLAIGGLQATVMEDTETVDTRAEGVDINDFDVVITDEAGETVYTSKYADVVAATEPIALQAGKYTISVSSQPMEGAAWERPVYSATRNFEIKRLETTKLEPIVCKLSNIKVTVAYAADIKDQLDPKFTTMTVAVGANSLVYSMTEERGGYFQPEAETSSLKLALNCRYLDSTKDIVMTNTIDNVKPAQWHKINVTIQHAADGTATIGITCDTWTFEEEVTFDTTSYVMEEVLIDDTDMPEIRWEGHDLAEEFELSDELFNADGNFTSSINLDVTSKSKIKSLTIAAASDSDEFIAEYTSYVPQTIDLCTTTLSEYKLSTFGYVKVGADANSVQLKFGKQANLMKAFEGLHTYTITVEDANGRKTVAELKINAGQNVAPKIVWVGYNIDERQTYIAGMTCDLTIKAPLTIADFTVKIISETLNASQLAAVGLASEFSLVKDEQYFIALGGDPNADNEEKREGLGFPVGDEVLGQTELNLSITKFLGVLAVLGPGEHDFEMSVTDVEGNTTTKTVMFRFE